MEVFKIYLHCHVVDDDNEDTHMEAVRGKLFYLPLASHDTSITGMCGADGTRTSMGHFDEVTKKRSFVSGLTIASSPVTCFNDN
jgi:hypothetical protein